MTGSRPDQVPQVNVVHSLLRACDWQDRTEFAQVCAWWRDGGRGVLALVGIGGAGKTAIANRFVSALPGLTEPLPGQPQDASLPVPDGLFVFSFYDVPNPEHFFDGLYGWLVEHFGQPDRRRVTESGQHVQASTTQVIEALTHVRRRLLIVLDGLEKVQDDGSRGGVFGRLQDGGLRAFLLRVTAGLFRGLAVLVTTRFVVSDLEYERIRGQAPLFSCIPVEEISDEACIALLRHRSPCGVRGSDAVLREIGRACGRHALTVDLVGGYLVHFHEGDPSAPLDLPLPEQIAAVAQQEHDPWKKRVAEQTARFSRVAEQYRRTLLKIDPAALALLQRVCLFRLGVDAKTLTLTFTGQAAREISGPALAGLDHEQLLAKFRLLVEMRLLERSERSDPKSDVYIVHPAVRDGFLAGLDPDMVRRGHEGARQVLEASLGDRPGRNPSDPALLDRLEEIVYHTVEAGDLEEAASIYQYRIGGHANLFFRIGSFDRGERICRLLLKADEGDSRLSRSSKRFLLTQRALYLELLGDLATALMCLESSLELSTEKEDWYSSSVDHQNLADSHLLAGHLTKSLLANDQAVACSVRTTGALKAEYSFAFRGYARGLQGDMQSALDDFQKCLEWQQRNEGGETWPLTFLRGVQHALILSRLNRSDEAQRLTQWNKNFLLMYFDKQSLDLQKCNLVLADLACQRSDLAVADELLRDAHKWAVERDAKELLCWAIQQTG